MAERTGVDLRLAIRGDGGGGSGAEACSGGGVCVRGGFSVGRLLEQCAHSAAHEFTARSPAPLPAQVLPALRCTCHFRLRLSIDHLGFCVVSTKVWC